MRCVYGAALRSRNTCRSLLLRQSRLTCPAAQYSVLPSVQYRHYSSTPRAMDAGSDRTVPNPRSNIGGNTSNGTAQNGHQNGTMRYFTVQQLNARGLHRAFIAFGSNLGDRIAWIEKACRAMDEEDGIRITRTSGLYETKAMYVEDQNNFINGACEVG